MATPGRDLGRNDPCHCGSGKKYKKCHMAQDEARAREARELRTVAEWAAFHARALCEAALPMAEAAPAVVAASERFFDGIERPARSLNHVVFRQHALFDVPLDDDARALTQAPLDEIDADAERLEKLRTGLLESHASVLEVTEVKRGRGLRLLDRLTGADRFVWDAPLSEQLDPMEVIIGRLAMHGERPVLLEGWEKVFFRGRKKLIAELEARLIDVGLEEDDADGRRAWLEREAPALYAAVRRARPAPADGHESV